MLLFASREVEAGGGVIRVEAPGDPSRRELPTAGVDADAESLEGCEIKTRIRHQNHIRRVDEESRKPTSKVFIRSGVNDTLIVPPLSNNSSNIDILLFECPCPNAWPLNGPPIALSELLRSPLRSEAER
jgi:hypothetical protein